MDNNDYHKKILEILKPINDANLKLIKDLQPAFKFANQLQLFEKNSPILKNMQPFLKMTEANRKVITSIDWSFTEDIFKNMPRFDNLIKLQTELVKWESIIPRLIENIEILEDYVPEDIEQSVNDFLNHPTLEDSIVSESDEKEAKPFIINWGFVLPILIFILQSAQTHIYSAQSEPIAEQRHQEIYAEEVKQTEILEEIYKAEAKQSETLEKIYTEIKIDQEEEDTSDIESIIYNLFDNLESYLNSPDDNQSK
ncbi:hypothetical protein MKX67_08890 [Cytobacillus sp. FSL W7-1323]|uniref:hypothetical protein n=1 Tax=Cytobacillus sp. FSL W7-1323 TaxID=2921700 RepID=UPI003158ED2F